ncbi:MAG TPA: hypothetical protein VN181_04815, partial [Thermoanaerobaculia bacterium]|nr:hypothetical protein [Thermoanaerobaculia bacterium]
AILKNVDNPKYTFSAAGSEKVGSVDGRVVEINADGTALKWIVDPSNGKILRKISRGMGPMPGDQVSEYLAWKTVDGVTLPSEVTMLRNGEKAGELKVSQVEINGNVDAALFVKPAK